MEAAAVKFALGKVDDLLKKGLELYNVGEEITQMQVELSMIEGFLQDADSKRNTNPAVQRWVNQVREVAYRIEAAIDTFLVDIEGNGRRRFGHFSKLLMLVKKPFKLKKLGDEVKAIRKTLRTIGQTRTDLGITNVAAANDENDEPPFRPTIPEEIDDSDVVGLESDKDKIIKHLLDRNVSRRTVLSIVGIGGIGKTTLAKKVFESTELAGGFDCKIWLPISQQFNVHDLMRKILEELQHKKLDIEDNKLWRELQGFLNEKRYFIILDDVWGTDLWERLKIALPDIKNASRVLITSRFEDVAKAADRDTKPYKLGYLNDDESLALLFRKAFPNREPAGRSYQLLDPATSDQTYYLQPYPAELNEVAKQLSKKCDGLPLALIVLGGILSTREESYAAWQQVNSTLNWHTEKTKLCAQVLRLSYADLPDYLKQCFLYFASFPEDHKISANHVIRMWIAEEFISRDEPGTMEDTAQEYLRELVQRCLVEVDEKSWNGNYKICHMHDLLRDMAIHEAKKVNFFTVLSKEDDCSQLASERVHRASLQCASTPPNFSGHSKSTIRSLLCFGNYISDYRGFRQLRVLTIENVNMEYKEINYEGLLEGLIHLRYLGFRYCKGLPNGFERIPFSSMKNLETVDCKGTTIEIHNDSTSFSFWNVPTLKHVIMYRGDRGETLPVLPSKWDHLKNLQTLKWVRLKNFPEFELEYDINLRTLGIQTVIDETVAAQQVWCTLKNLLKRTEHLVSFSIVSYNRNDLGAGCIPLLTEGTRGLACHERIQFLYLYGRLEKDICDLSVEMLPTNLTKLTLRCSYLEEDPMPILEKLQCLRVLRLRSDAFLTEGSTCTEEGFPSLQKLVLGFLSYLRYWDIKEGAMRRLSHLQIFGCPLHPFPELQKVPNLKELKLHNDIHKRMRPEDHKKIKHIPSVRVESR